MKEEVGIHRNNPIDWKRTIVRFDFRDSGFEFAGYPFYAPLHGPTVRSNPHSLRIVSRGCS